MNKEQIIREMIQIELIYQTRQRILKEQKHKNSLYFLFENELNEVDPNTVANSTTTIPTLNPGDVGYTSSPEYEDEDFDEDGEVDEEDVDDQNTQEVVATIGIPTDNDIYQYIFENKKKIKDGLIPNKKLPNYDDREPISFKIFRAINDQISLNADSTEANAAAKTISENLKRSIEKFYKTKNLGGAQINSIYTNFISNSSMTANQADYITYFNSFVFFPFDHFDVYKIQKNVTSNNAKRLNPLKALEKNFYVQKLIKYEEIDNPDYDENVTGSKEKINNPIYKNQLNISNDVYEIDNKSISDMLREVDKTGKYGGKFKYFPLDVYLNVKAEGAFGPGKGEFLMLSLIKYAKSGGAEYHDLMLVKKEYLNTPMADIMSAQRNKTQKNSIFGEIEVKQGKGGEGSVSMNLNVRRDTPAEKAKSKFIKDINNFFKKFHDFTSDIDEMFQISGMLESKNFVDAFVGTGSNQANVPSSTIFELFDPDESNPNIFDKVKAYGGSFDRLLINLVDFISTRSSTSQNFGLTRGKKSAADISAAREQAKLSDPSAAAVSRLVNANAKESNIRKSITQESQSIYTLLQNAIQAVNLNPNVAEPKVENSKFQNFLPKLEEALKILSLIDSTNVDVANNPDVNKFLTLTEFINDSNKDILKKQLGDFTGAEISKGYTPVRIKKAIKNQESAFKQKFKELVEMIQNPNSITDKTLKNEFIETGVPRYSNFKSFEFTPDMIDKLKTTYLIAKVDTKQTKKNEPEKYIDFELSDSEVQNTENSRVINIMDFFNNLKNKANNQNTKSMMSAVTGETLRNFSDIYFEGILNQYIYVLGFYRELLDEIKEELNKQTSSGIETDRLKEIKTLLKQAETQKLDIKDFSNLDPATIKNYRELMKYKSFLELYEVLTLDEEEIVIQFKHLSKNKQLKNVKDVSFSTNDFQIVEPKSMNANLDKFFAPDDPTTPDDDMLTIKFKNSAISPEQFQKIMRNKNLFSFLNQVQGANQPVGDLKAQYITKQNLGIVDMLDQCIKDALEFQNAIQEEYTQNDKGFIAYFHEDSYNTKLTDFGFIFNDKHNNFNSQFKDMSAVNNVISDQNEYDKFMTNNKLLLMKDMQSGPMTLWQSNDKLNDSTIFGALVSIRKKFVEYSKKIKDEVEKINKSATAIKTINQKLNGGSKQEKEEYLGDILKNKLR